MKDVIVTGGRDYDDAEKMAIVLGSLDLGMVIQGGASGADLLAKKYARKCSRYIETFEADWDKHGRAAGPIRNGEMLDAHPNALVIAFPGGKGTENCVEQAIAKGMTILRVL